MTLPLFKNLIQWSEGQYSDLPWRRERTLYRTLVSEIMLQQTTVGTVLNHFERFLKTYPTIFDLALSTEEEVCIEWKGLGYYRRARSLRNLAIQIVEKYKGKIPTNIDALLGLKGIGPYTANAIVAIGADKKALAVDANLERVLSRYYGVSLEKGPKLQKKLWHDFDNESILTEINSLSARALNESLMDLGRIICQSRKASCVLCPLRLGCVAFQNKKPLDYPLVSLNKKKEDLYIKLLRIIVSKQQKILVYQKNETQWLSGQWELPTFVLETNDDKLKQYPGIKFKKKYLALNSFKSGITKYSIENYICHMDLEDFKLQTKGMGIEYSFKVHDKKLNLTSTSMKILKIEAQY